MLSFMSHLGTSNFVPDEEDLSLHEFFDFSSTFNKAAKIPNLPGNDPPDPPLLRSPFTRSLEDIQGQEVGWLSPPATSTSDCLDAVNFEDFLSLDESPDNISTVDQEVPSSLSLEANNPSTPVAQVLISTDNTEGIQAVTDLASANAEIARLQALLTAQSPQSEPMTPPGNRQERSSPRKRKPTDSESSPPKRQTKTHMGPIEAMWSPNVTQFEREAFCEKLASPQTPLPLQAHLNFSVPPFMSCMSSHNDFEISTEDIQSMKTFIRENSGLVHGISRRVANFAPTSDIDTATYSNNMKPKRAPFKCDLQSSPRSTTNATDKVTKKARVTPKKWKHQHTTLTASTTSTSTATHFPQRSMEELMALNFYSLNEQEKCRILLPMLRGLDPKELEASFVKPPRTQDEGPNHYVQTTRATRSCSSIPEADDALVTKFKTETLPLLSPTNKVLQSPTPNSQVLPILHKISANVDASEDHGAVRQREALEKAASLHVQGRKR